MSKNIDLKGQRWRMRIGIDLGGTKIEGLLLDPQGGECGRYRVTTPAGDYSATLQAIASIVHHLETRYGKPAHIGIGIPGTLSPETGLVKNANSVCLIGHPIDRDLQALLGRPVRAANDADCFALSEATDGAGKGAASVFGVILGTGVGGGIVVRGQLLGGPNAITGEWGHNPLPWPTAQDQPAPACYCGQQGCIETYLSGPGLSAEYLKISGRHADPTLIMRRLAALERHAIITMDHYYERLAKSIATVINVLDPEVIVLGGGLSNIGALYTEVPRRWSTYVFSDRVNTRLLPAKFGDSSGVRGAAWLWPPTQG